MNAPERTSTTATGLSADGPLEVAIRALSEADLLYLLVDPALADQVVGAPELSALPRERVPIAALSVDRRPYLLSLQNAAHNERALNASLRLQLEEARGLHDTELGRPRSLCAWLVVRDRTVGSLAMAMARSAIAYPPRGTAVTFRFWDPRVMAHLPRVLAEAHLRGWLASCGIDQWWCFAEQEEGAYGLKCLEPGQDFENATRDRASYFGTFDADQWRLLNALGWANRLTGVVGNWELAIRPGHRELETLALRAMAWGLSREADVLRFVHCALTLHRLFDTHPDVARALDLLQGSAPAGFAELAQSWDDAFLDELRSGAWIDPSSMPADPLADLK